MKTLISMGIGLVILLAIFAITQDYTATMKYASYAGGAFIIIAAITTGILGSGDRIRANYSDDTDWKMRMNVSWYCFLIGIINLTGSFMTWYFFLKPPS